LLSMHSNLPRQVLRLFKIMNIPENFPILASSLAFARKRLVGTRRGLE
jgi:hypothetical protein